MEIFLVLNRYEISASLEEPEATILAVASSKLNREELLNWLNHHQVEKI